MIKWVGLILSVCFALLVAILCTRLNTEQELLKVTKLNAEAAQKRLESADVELECSFYKLQKYEILYKDIEHKDDWKQDLEEFKRLNGYYEE